MSSPWESTVAPALWATSSIELALVTLTCDLPSWVLSRRRAVLAALSQSVFVHLVQRYTYVSFSKVTVADLTESVDPDEGVIERLVIFPLDHVRFNRYCMRQTNQKLKKSLTSFSLVSWEIPETWTVVDIFGSVIWIILFVKGEVQRVALIVYRRAIQSRNSHWNTSFFIEGLRNTAPQWNVASTFEHS